MSDLFWIEAASVVMGLAVALGAFAAHGLKDVLSPDMKAVFETAVRYQAYHGLALFAVAWLTQRLGTSWISAAGWCFLCGIVLFSGSLYILSLTGVRAWGIVTPVGGLSFIAGWTALFFGGIFGR
jgi:uncharacterized membrane protein YgdD (TMEM256/DUF423 family)